MDVNFLSARSGRLIKENGQVVNEANGINADGSQNVVLTGRKVEEIVLVNAQDIRDTTERTVLFDAAKYSAFELFFTNTLNQPLYACIRVSLVINRLAVPLTDGTTKRYSPYPTDAGAICSVIPPMPETIRLRLSDTLFDKQNGMVMDELFWKSQLRDGMYVGYRCDTAPTSGNLSIHLLGVPL
ncbi:hypothetical protein J31TS4_19110 [Paenibacillus sp. J31TS4]|uniref:hypothetical protein n=1 Tax=Paenibacillus sp. J31TS4 TaxID=2807195 RepID=UPI001B10FB8E|nr:hypothetical protein [Paenibacillus sp. J31TS4]GIP38631.1 hypothetical protein J31TS4_19110 [Paenibacillus sp. J31TS4]